MQRISFDFMARRIRQRVHQTFAAAKRSFKERDMTAEQLEEAKRKRMFELQFIPETRYGPGLLAVVSDKDSRQVKRRKLRTAAFADMTRRFPGVPRRIRRSMAFDFIRNASRRAAA